MRIYAMAWEEKERGWGHRPDGWSLHLTSDDYDRHLERHSASTPWPLPEEYSFPVQGLALRPVEIADDHPLAKRLMRERSLRIEHHERLDIEQLLGVSWPGL